MNTKKAMFFSTIQKTSILVIILLMGFAGYLFYQSWIKFRTQESLIWKVERVLDGDTVVLSDFKHPKVQLTVRLACIDAPEKSQPKIGRNAQIFLESLVQKAQGIVHLKDAGKDHYGRTLGLIFAQNDSRSLNELLVQSGQVYAHYLYGPLCQNIKSRLETLAFLARQKNIGLYRSCAKPKMNCVKPWIWRKKLKHRPQTQLGAVEIAPKGFLSLDENF